MAPGALRGVRAICARKEPKGTNFCPVWRELVEYACNRAGRRPYVTPSDCDDPAYLDLSTPT